MMKHSGAVDMVETVIGKRETEIAGLNLQKLGIDTMECESPGRLIE